MNFVRLEVQEHLMFVCFYILLNLAEDISIEVKMKNRKITKQLVRSDPCCLIAVDIVLRCFA